MKIIKINLCKESDQTVLRAQRMTELEQFAYHRYNRINNNHHLCKNRVASPETDYLFLLKQRVLEKINVCE